MRILTIFHYTGREATNLKVAARLNHKLKSAQRLGQCTLLDWSGVERIEPEFIRDLTQDLLPEKVHLGRVKERFEKWESAKLSQTTKRIRDD